MSNDRIQINSDILKKIADNFPIDSPEYQALKISALAFSYAILKYEKEFDKFVDDLWKPLTSKS